MRTRGQYHIIMIAIVFALIVVSIPFTGFGVSVDPCLIEGLNGEVGEGTIVELSNASSITTVSSFGSAELIDGGGYHINFLGDFWHSGLVQLRYDNMPYRNLSLQKCLVMVLDLLEPDPGVSNPLTMWFIDPNFWDPIDGGHTSNIVPVIDLGSDVEWPQTVIIPMSDLMSGSEVDPSHIKDFYLEVEENDDLDREVIISEFRAIGGPPEGTKAAPPELVSVQGDLHLVSLNTLEVILDGDVNLTLAENPLSWSLASTGDPIYTATVSPISVGRFTVALDADDAYTDGENIEGVELRHTFYLQFETPLKNDFTYELVVSPTIKLPVDPNDGYQVTFQNGTATITPEDDPDVVYYVITPGGESPYFLSTEGPWDVSIDPLESWMFTPGIGAYGARAIKINQFGYSSAADARYAYVGYWLGSSGPLSLTESLVYHVMRKVDGAEVMSGTTLKRAYEETIVEGEVVGEVVVGDLAGIDLFSGEYVHEVNLAGLPSGEYYLEIDSVGRSFPFQIGGQNFEAFYHIARALYHQRCGVELSEPYTSWTRDVCHEKTYFLDEGDGICDWSQDFPEDTITPPEKMTTIAGGWHDAGDFDRRPTHIKAVQTFMALYEIFPSAFGDGILNIPESGNGRSDLMDEALYGLKFWVDTQNTEEGPYAGSVRSGSQATGHPSYGFASQDDMDYWVYDVGMFATYSFAAASAQAARILKKIAGLNADHPDVVKYKKRALMAWRWAEENSDICVTVDPAICTANSNGGQSLEDMLFGIGFSRMNAAGQLFAMTGDDVTGYDDFLPGFEDFFSNTITFKDAFADEWADHGSPIYSRNIINVWGMAVADVPDSDPGGEAASLIDLAKNRIIGLADQYTDRLQQNAYRHSRSPHYPVAWGTGSGPADYMMPVVLAYNFEPKQEYVDAVAQNVDFQLGVHPMAKSWVSGMGYFSVERPLHLDSLAHIDTESGVGKPVPGIAIDGPVHYSYEDECEQVYWRCYVYESFSPHASEVPPLYHYSPWAGMANMNEFAIEGNFANNVPVYGMLYALSQEAPVDFDLEPSDFPRHPTLLAAANTTTDDDGSGEQSGGDENDGPDVDGTDDATQDQDPDFEATPGGGEEGDVPDDEVASGSRSSAPSCSLIIDRR